MTTVTDHMKENHRHCDSLFAAAEAAVSSEDWNAAQAAWPAFVEELEQHITIKEEAVLFPALEAINGPTGPTQMMRMEHQQMRALISQISEALANRDSAAYLGLADTLMMLMQQHNMKEEQILYPMIDDAGPNGLALLEDKRA